jgi:nucleotide-binding universal stress UspA family protein
MYKNIMAPVDGSELAECVLPHVESIAKGCGVATVLFVRVVEPVHLPVGTDSDGGSVFTEKDAARIREQTDSHNQKLAKQYLDRLISHSKYDGVDVEAAVIVGKPAESLAEYAENNGVDLIVISTHGRSGISRWVWGSVADKILRSACVPVLMVRAPGCIPGI